MLHHIIKKEDKERKEKNEKERERSNNYIN